MGFTIIIMQSLFQLERVSPFRFSRFHFSEEWGVRVMSSPSREWHTAVNDPPPKNSCVGFRLQGSGCRVQGAGFRVQGSGCRVQGAGFRKAPSPPSRPSPSTSRQTCSTNRGCRRGRVLAVWQRCNARRAAKQGPIILSIFANKLLLFSGGGVPGAIGAGS